MLRAFYFYTSVWLNMEGFGKQNFNRQKQHKHKRGGQGQHQKQGDHVQGVIQLCDKINMLESERIKKGSGAQWFW